MLTHVCVDSFRCFQNLEVDLGEISLLMGDNGSGKSSFLAVLEALRSLVIDQHTVADVLPTSSLCRRDERPVTRIELVVRLPDPVEGGSLQMRYRLEVDHNKERRRARVTQEMLHTDEGLLVLFSDGNVYLFRDDTTPWPEFSSDWTRSARALVAERGDSRRLAAFRRSLRDMIVVRMAPPAIDTEARHPSQENQDHIVDLTQRLRETLPGYRSSRLVEVGLDARALMVRIQPDGGQPECSFAFGELSNGERALMVLYTVLYGPPEGQCAQLIDERANYVSLAEIQPWLMELADRCGNAIPQAILASHHPEVLDYLGPDHAIVFPRLPNGPTRARYGLPDDGSGLSVSERVAAGWHHG